MKKPKKPSKALKSIAADIIKSAPKLKKAKPSSKLSPIMQQLVKAREASGLSKTQLADKMKKHLGQVVLMENGKNKSPSLPLLQAYAKSLDLQIVMDLKPLRTKK